MTVKQNGVVFQLVNNTFDKHLINRLIKLYKLFHNVLIYLMLALSVLHSEESWTVR